MALSRSFRGGMVPAASWRAASTSRVVIINRDGCRCCRTQVPQNDEHHELGKPRSSVVFWSCVFLELFLATNFTCGPAIPSSVGQLLDRETKVQRVRSYVLIK